MPKEKNLIQRVLRRFARNGRFNWMPDKLYLQVMYFANMWKLLNLKNPQTFNEKLQWLKLYDRKAEYTTMVDKYEAKGYVAERIGEEYIVPTYGVWDRFDDIDFDALPNQFVLKCTHDSGGLVICRDKAKLDKVAAKEKIERSLRRNYYLHGREWPYKNVKPRILAEKYLEDVGNNALPVYKILCFGGKAKIIQAIQNDKLPSESIDYFDVNWVKLDLRQNFPNSQEALSKPAQLPAMLAMAEIISNGFPFLRVDFYSVNGQVFFSENTFYSDAGFARFYPDCWDETLGSWILLSDCK